MTPPHWSVLPYRESVVAQRRKRRWKKTYE